MHKIKRLNIFLILLMLGVAFSTTASAFSFGSFFNLFQKKPVQTRPVVKPSGQRKLQPAQVKIGVYVLHVSKYDLQSANYRMDFYLIFKCKPVCKDINFEIMNATDVTSHLVEKQADSLVFRVQADLNKADNLRNYPFDSHDLDIVVEDKLMTNDRMVFEVDPTSTALDSNLNVVGYHLLPSWSAKVASHYYPIFQKTFSNYKFTMVIQRPWVAGILKGILPALIIICCNFLALFMEIDHASQRLSIGTSTLIASVVFHLNLTSSVPPLGYVTYADMFMFINYLCLLVVLIEVVVTTYFVETKHHTLAQRINTICAWLIPITWLCLQLTNWFAFNPITDVNGLGPA